MTDSNRLFLDAFGRYEKPLVRYAMGYTGDLGDARDVVQDVFLKLNQNIGSIDPQRIAAWLFTACRNRALDLHRKHKRMVIMEHDALEAHDTSASYAPSPSDQMEGEETKAMLHRMIQELPAKQRQAVWLKFVTGISYAEISQVMETSLGNVGYLIHHGVARIRERWHAMELAK
jgi:RNA polymerase sigma factor (sigma-70 family)